MVITLDWDKMHVLSRKEVCFRACVNEEYAALPWKDIEPWLLILLSDHLTFGTTGVPKATKEEP